ncbi:Fine tangled pili major subunit [Rosistilla carotiformis]|uniref:Fine tangled pili major subunit n=1 Tax=Rosistilla carotiformis TaxID=2528017 RepID=A0A518JVB0_9BACT|nr:DNA starvation/stationary phase protection protein [Rosistilla carotiformis]QDV69483.1 Fine tangled pili major subunit [Rosistilla carotiformis]
MSSTSESIDVTPKLSHVETELRQNQELIDIPIGLDRADREKTVYQLNQLLADSIMLKDMYKKHHWQVAGPTFYQIHLMLDKHYAEQVEIVDTIAERIQLLGGAARGMPADVAEKTQIPNPPRGRELLTDQLTRLLQAHEVICTYARFIAQAIGKRGDLGSEDMVVGDVLRVNEFQAWFIAEHLAPIPLENE